MADVVKVKADIAKVKADIAKVKADNAKVKADNAKVKADNAKVKADIAKVKADIVKVKADIAKVKADIAKVKADIAKVKADIAKVKAGSCVQSADFERFFRQAGRQVSICPVRTPLGVPGLARRLNIIERLSSPRSQYGTERRVLGSQWCTNFGRPRWFGDSVRRTGIGSKCLKCSPIAPLPLHLGARAP